MAQAIRDELIEELLQGYSSPQDLLDEEGLFKELKKRLLELEPVVNRLGGDRWGQFIEGTVFADELERDERCRRRRGRRIEPSGHRGDPHATGRRRSYGDFSAHGNPMTQGVGYSTLTAGEFIRNLDTKAMLVAGK
jgi:hypothetical protein